MAPDVRFNHLGLDQVVWARKNAVLARHLGIGVHSRPPIVPHDLGAPVEMLIRARLCVFVPGDIIPLGIGAPTSTFVGALSEVLEIGAQPVRRLDFLGHVREPEVDEAAFTDFIDPFLWDD